MALKITGAIGFDRYPVRYVLTFNWPPGYVIPFNLVWTNYNGGVILHNPCSGTY